MKKIMLFLTIFSLGFTLVGCVPEEISCDEGFSLVNGECIEDVVVIECEEGFELINDECEEIPPVCEDGFTLVDGECLEDIIECDLPETLVGDVCELTHVLLPDFIGMDYGEVLVWSFDNDINLNQSSEYNDDVEPNSVFYQEYPAGSYVEFESEIIIKYSRGLDPNGVIAFPDFTNWNESEIKVWLNQMDINKYTFKDAFDLDVRKGYFVGYEVSKIDDHEGNLRRDSYTFLLSKGPLEIEEVSFSNQGTVRGVNLGGWFVLEGWMTPGLFSDVEGSDETEFMRQKENAEEAIEEHWDTFITEDDFIWLADHNVEYVRIPIPWWYKGGLAYEGLPYEVTYANSEFYIHRAMQWAETHGIKVLLDLHAAPGCQNGFDNGGIAGIFEWPYNSDYIDLTKEIIGDITVEFSVYNSLWGIEVLNEPAWAVPMDVLKNYYLDTYEIIRSTNQNVWIGFHDGFRGYMYWEWEPFFNENDFTNVFFDIHLYQIFGDFWSDFDIHDHLDWVDIEQYKAIQRYDNVVDVIVGEWSIGLQGNVYEGLNADSINKVKLAFAHQQLNEYEDSMGWFFWNYKIDANSHMEWDFRRLVENNIFPNDFSDQENTN